MACRAGVLLLCLRRNVSGNQLKGPIPATWAKLSVIARLELADNQFSGAVPKWLTSMPGLWVL
jgi:hypothetical protein